MVVTVPQFIYVAETVVRNQTPYVFGGISLTKGCDCSGMIYGTRIMLGLPPGPRTTQAMAQTWPFIPVGQERIGDLPIFEVDADTGDPPQHIGLLIATGIMCEEPHTGTFGSIVDVPNTAGERLMGYLRMPDVIPYIPTSAPTQEMDMSDFFASDPVTGGIWGTDINGSNYPAGGAPLIPGLNAHPNFHAGSAESGGTNPCVGIVYWRYFENDGIYYVTAPTNGEGGWDGSVNPASKVCPYNLYRFLRNGTPA